MIRIYHARWDAIYIPAPNKGRIAVLNITLALGCNETEREEAQSYQQHFGRSYQFPISNSSKKVFLKVYNT